MGPRWKRAIAVCLVLPGVAMAGAPPDWSSSVEGQWGVGGATWSPDGSLLAVTRWDRVGLVVVDDEGSEVGVASWARGAGFHPTWVGGALVFKEVDERGHRLVRFDPHTHVRVVLDAAPLLGEASVAADGTVVWTRGGGLVVDGTVRVDLPGYSNLAEVDPAGRRVALHHPDGSPGVLHLDDGHIDWLAGPGPWSHPRWSPDGSRLLVRGSAGWFHVFDPATGTEERSVQGTHPQWSPGSGEVVFDRVGVSAFQVDSSVVWALDEDGVTRVLTDQGLHARWPAPGPDGQLAFVDTRSGTLMLARDGELVELVGADDLPDGPRLLRGGLPFTVDVPYMHQLWDTPDDFNGSWSCGPTTAMQIAQRYHRLPDLDLQCSWPTVHDCPWSWYITHVYTYRGFTYDIWGIAAAGVWVQGSHGYICEGDVGGGWGDHMVGWLDQQGVDSWWATTSFDTVRDEVNAGYPLYLLGSVLGAGHYIVVRGYGDDHSMVINDPYGDAGSGDWGNYDGEAVVYDWPGYNNGHLEIGVSHLFGSRGPDWGASHLVSSIPVSMRAGETATAWVEYRNAGVGTWSPGRTLLGTTEPRGHRSVFAHDSWPAPDRPATVDEATHPGERGRFTFTLAAPQVDAPTTFVEHLGLVDSQGEWFGPADDLVQLSVRVVPEVDTGLDTDVGELPPRHLLEPGCGCNAATGALAPWAGLVVLWRRRRSR